MPSCLIWRGVLNNLGNSLSGLGRGEEALAASQEAADIYRRLAAIHPDAFLPNLAMSLDTLGQILGHEGQFKEAAASFETALSAIVPFFEQTPQAFRELVENMIGDYAWACRSAGVKENASVVERMREAVERARAGAIAAAPEPEVERARYAAIDELYEKALATGELDEGLLAKFPEDAARRARGLWAVLRDGAAE